MIVITILFFATSESLPSQTDFYTNPGLISTTTGIIELSLDSMYFRNDKNIQEPIAEISEEPGLAKDYKITYRNILGKGRDLSFEAQEQLRRIELLIRPGYVPNPKNINGKLFLDYDFKLGLSQGLKVYVNGEEWDESLTPIAYSLDIRSPQGNILFLFSQPYAEDFSHTLHRASNLIRK
nr:hypothetical protein [Nanoarchaeota archaeon]